MLHLPFKIKFELISDWSETFQACKLACKNKSAMELQISYKYIYLYFYSSVHKKAAPTFSMGGVGTSIS